jgi:predicted DNA-binding transcriptional regulator AlpA
MSNQRTEIALLSANLSDDAILTRPQACAMISVSEDTLLRLLQKGEGPECVRLSPRRIGYRVGAIRSWLKRRATAA